MEEHILNLLYSEKRIDTDSPNQNNDVRTHFQRDFDRIIFSSPFRRLQNKTQVFPLPGSVFVHNRLTHSLEVASVGRSLGTIIGRFITENYKNLTDKSIYFYQLDLSNVIAAACLCHDIGNPAFGHSGEDAIASFFIKNESYLKNYFSEKEWLDFIHFEGNANAIRVLTHSSKGKSKGGLRLTCTTLAAIAKYPCESTASNKNSIHTKKIGFFQSEKETFQTIAKETYMKKNSDEPLSYVRHPFVWLVELADDICYNIIDIEDAHRLGIIEHENCYELFKNLIQELDTKKLEKVQIQIQSTTDKNDKIGFLRAIIINLLIKKSTEIYQDKFEKILKGEWNEPIFDVIKNQSPSLQKISDFSIKNIYNNRSVVEIENAGYNVMNELLGHFIFPILKDKKERRNQDKKALELLPSAFNYDEKEDNYQKVMGILDYVSGMTDNYATELYRKIKGIDIGMKI